MTYIKIIQGLEFQWEEDYAWEGGAVLSSWAGFRFGYFSGSDSASDGSVCIIIEPDDIENDIEPSEVQIQAIKWLLEHEDKVSKSILQKIFQEYSNQQDIFRDFLEDEFDALMPNLEHQEDLKKLIGLTNLVVHNVAKEGLTYIGFSLNCTWDSEHALGLMMHGDRVVKFGGADTALLEWIAREDAVKN